MKPPDNPFKRFFNWLAANPPSPPPSSPFGKYAQPYVAPPLPPLPKTIKIKVKLIRETALRSGGHLSNSNENMAASVIIKHYVSVYGVYDNEKEYYKEHYDGNSEENAKMIYDTIIQQKGQTKNQETLSETTIIL